MKRSASLLVFALICTLSPGMASAAKICKNFVKVTRSVDVTFRGRATRAVQSTWETAATKKYGDAYGEWKLAIDKHKSCKKIELRA